MQSDTFVVTAANTKGDRTMLRPTVGRLLLALIAAKGVVDREAAQGAVPNSLMLNEANTVSGDVYLDKGRGDANRHKSEPPQPFRARQE